MDSVNSPNITANITKYHRFRRHDNFVTDIKLPTCAMVQVFPYESRCKYVQSTEQCHESVFVIDYMNLMYCTFAPRETYAIILSVCFLTLIIICLFYILGATADNFFCPSLKVLSKMLKLNENLAGVTLLAFGNSAPDLFTSIAGLQGETREVYNDVLGSSIFVVLLVAAVIICAKPFVASGPSLLRDASFLILGVIYLDFIVHTGHVVTLLEAILIFSLYILYICVVIMDQYLLLRAARVLSIRISTAYVSQQDSSLLKQIKSEAGFAIIARHSSRHSGSQLHHRATKDSEEWGRVGLFEQAWETVLPFTKEKWRESHRVTRILLCFSAPLQFLLNILIPVVDYEEPLDGWSKLLNCVQIVILPPFVIFGFTPATTVFDLPIYVLIMVITIPLGISVFLITTTDAVPDFHKYFSILGTVGSVFVVYACAQETIEILNVIGIITHRSNSFLGCTLLAWGNSIGDLVSNLTMAIHGYHKMGLAACFGGPLFNTLLSIGMIYIYRAATSPNFEYETGPGTLGENSTYFLLFGLIGLLLSAILTNFQLRRSIGFFPLFVYFLYIAYALMSELEVMHGYGNDHRLDVKAEPAV